MTRAEFVEGFIATLRWSATTDAQTALRRAITRADLDGDVLSALQAELFAFWAAHSLEIPAAPGIAGCSQSVSWQAGHDLCFVRNGRVGFYPAHWGDVLAATMATEARALGRVAVAAVDGVLGVTRPPGKQQG